MDGGKEVVLSFSDGSVKDSGTIGPGAYHVKGQISLATITITITTAQTVHLMNHIT